MKHSILLTFALAHCIPAALQAQHGHLSAGATAQTEGAQVIWANGADFIASSGYVKTLDYTNAGAYANYYQGGITLTALPATFDHGFPDPAAAALGSYLQFSMSCLSAPPDGSFAFWERNATSPTLSLTAGQSATNLFRLSESDGSPGSDPYGHVHNRRFTATKRGIYKIGFTAHDTSNNGSGSGPIHTPSQELPIWFQAGVNIESIRPDFQAGRVRIRYGAAAGFQWSVQYLPELSTGTNWSNTPPVLGNDTFMEATPPIPLGQQGFFRLLGVPFTP